MGVAVLVGTRKGLFVLRSDEARHDWKVEGPHLTGWEVFHAMGDPRDGTLRSSNRRSRIGSPRSASRPLVNVYVDRAQISDLGAPLEGGTELRLVAAVAGG